QVHAPRRSCRGPPGADREAPPADRHRQRSRHQAGPPAATLRALLASRQLDHAGPRRSRPRAGRGPTSRRAAWRHRRGGQRGRGATFTVTVPVLWRAKPAERPRPAPATDDATARLPGLKALVVDDDADTCQVIGAVLAQAGAEVRTCLSASQALIAMDSWVPDVLVSDIGMPEEDGYALIRKGRARKSGGGGRSAAVGLPAD